MSNIHVPKARIIQPEGIRYMIQEYHYTKEYAHEYIDMLINKMEKYIEMKRRGELIAPLMTLEQMELQLFNMKKFTVEELWHDLI